MELFFFCGALAFVCGFLLLLEPILLRLWSFYLRCDDFAVCVMSSSSKAAAAVTELQVRLMRGMYTAKLLTRTDVDWKWIGRVEKLVSTRSESLCYSFPVLVCLIIFFQGPSEPAVLTVVGKIARRNFNLFATLPVATPLESMLLSCELVAPSMLPFRSDWILAMGSSRFFETMQGVEDGRKFQSLMTDRNSLLFQHRLFEVRVLPFSALLLLLTHLLR